MKKSQIAVSLVGYAFFILLACGGGRPSKGTPKDKRLKPNKPKPTKKKG